MSAFLQMGRSGRAAFVAACSCVCESLERSWRRAFATRSLPPAWYDCEPLEKRQLLSIAAASISGPGEITQGTAYVLTLGASIDTTVSYSSNWTVDYGDGSTPVTLDGSVTQDTHFYSAAGFPTISATLTDVEGDGSTYSSAVMSPVQVDEAAPTFSISGSDSALTYEDYQLGDSFSGPDGATIQTLSIAWGDGSVSNIDGDPGVYNHAYDSPGEYSINAVITADLTGDSYPSSYTANDVVTVDDEPSLSFSVSGDADVSVGQAYTLTDSFNHPPRYDLEGFAVDWGDGTTDSTSTDPGSFVHTYSTGGSYAIIAAAGGDTGGASYLVSTNVTALYGPPTFSISGDPTYTLGQEYDLTPSFANPDGNPANSYTVAWGDGSSDSYDGSSTVLAYTYSSFTTGGYTITATAMGDDGQNATATSVVEIAPPSLSLSAPDAYTQDDAFTLSISIADGNPDGWDVAQIDWGDGSTTLNTAFDSGPYTHAYSDPGTYAITGVDTEMEDGMTAVASTTIQVGPPGVGISVTASTVNNGDTVFLSGSFSDSNDDTPIQWDVDWGDGSTLTYAGYDDASYGPQNATHVYTEAGTYAIVADAVDPDGTWAATDAVTMTVYETAPTFSISGSDSALTYEDYQLGDSFSNSDGATIQTLSIAWGDGSVSNISGDPGATDHAYYSPGDYSITAVVTDADYNPTLNPMDEFAGSYTANNVVTVDDEPSLSFSVSGDAGVTVGQAYTLTDSFNHPPRTTLGGFSVDWGDGTTDWSSTDSGSFVHTYSTAGSYNIVAGAVEEDDSATYFGTSSVTAIYGPPTFSISGDPTYTIGQEYDLTPSFANPDGNPATSYTVAWGDGSSDSYDGSSTPLAYTYSVFTRGGYTITATAIGDDGQTATATSAVDIAPPSVSLSAPDEVAFGQTFTAEASIADDDPNGGDWDTANIDWGDGSPTASMAWGPSSYTYSYSESGTYTINASITNDEDGQTGTASVVVDVPPTVALSPESSPAVGQPFVMDQSIDDGGGVHTLSSFSVSWGDGGTDSDSTLPQTYTDGYADAFTHTYAAVGTFDVSATAVTEEGTFSTDYSVTVVPLAVGDSGSGYVAANDFAITPSFNDPGQTLSSYIVTWGDGSADSTYTAGASTFDHTYATADGSSPYGVTVQAIADDGTWTAYYQAEPLVAAWADQDPVDQGDTVNLDGEFYANNDQPTAWFVNWGDGGSTVTYDDGGDDSGPADATHIYDTPGTFSITASAADAVGTYSAQVSTIEVDVPTPTFSVDGVDTFTPGQAYVVTNSWSDNGVNDPTSYVVSWGDDTANSTYSGSATSFTHSYAGGPDSPYTIDVTANTPDGPFTAETSVDEAPPVVTISDGSSATEGAAFTLDDSFTDPGGFTPTLWNVDWGDGQSSTVSGDPNHITHTYDSQPPGGGDWTILASATATDGTFYADETTVAVADSTPTVSFTGSRTISDGTPASVFPVFNDPNGETPYDWTIAWGDNSGQFFFVGRNAPAAHLYPGAGTYEITAVARCADGSYSASTQVTVTPVAPTFSITGEGVGVGEEGITFNQASTFIDPIHQQTPVSYSIAWGDGTTSSYGLDPDYHGVFSHNYTLPGTYTEVATATLANGSTYTATATNHVVPGDGSGELDYLPRVASGQTFDVSLIYSDPSNDPITGYSVDWGDGSAESDSPVFTHAYEYDPVDYGDPGSYRVFTITVHRLSEGDFSLQGDIQVLPAGGSGSLNLSGDTTVAEGQTATLSASFSDPAQDPSFPGAAFDIAWGNGDSGGDGGYVSSDSFIETFSLAGEYTVRAEAFYPEPPDGTDYMAFATEVITVTPVMPTLTLDAGPTTIAAGSNDYELEPTFTDNFGNPDGQPQTWTIAWGDGTSDGYVSLNPYPSTEPYFAHGYTTAGTYQPMVTVSDPRGTYTASASVTVNDSNTVNLAGGGTAYENNYPYGESPATSVITRTGDTANPLTVNFTLNGSTDVGPYQVTDATGKILSGSVTIPAGSTYANVLITPLEDNTPRWTQTVDMTLTGSSDYTLGSSTTASTSIVNDDLSLYLNNGSNNIILDGSSDPGTLTFNYPVEGKNGATVTLVDNDPSDANVYLTADPGPDDTPILGDVDGTLVSTYTVVEGSGTMPRMAYVIPTKGSDSIGQVRFSGTDDDSETDNTDESNGITPITVAIVPVTDPNGSGLSNWAFNAKTNNQPLNWLVGQMVDVDAELLGPRGFVTGIPGLTYHWTIPSGDNVLERYIVGPTSAQKIAVSNDDGGAYSHIAGPEDLGVHTGLTQKRLQFFWVTMPSANPDTLSVDVSGIPFDGGQMPALAKFNVVSPTVNAVLGLGSPGSPAIPGIPAWNNVGLYTGYATGATNASDPTQGGAVYSAQVTVPSGFASGTFNFLQLVKPYRDITDTSNLTEIRTSPSGSFVLDDPFPVGGNYTWPLDNQDGWTTGALYKTTWDLPHESLSGLYRITMDDTFITYVMFKPGGTNSNFVPLESATWGYTMSAFRAGGGWVWLTGPVLKPTGATPNAAAPNAFASASTEPTWTGINSALSYVAAP
jgi:hypothetical protein